MADRNITFLEGTIVSNPKFIATARRNSIVFVVGTANSFSKAGQIDHHKCVAFDEIATYLKDYLVCGVRVSIQARHTTFFSKGNIYSQFVVKDISPVGRFDGLQIDEGQFYEIYTFVRKMKGGSFLDNLGKTMIVDHVKGDSDIDEDEQMIEALIEAEEKNKEKK